MVEFALTREEVAERLKLSFQQVRWAEESALRKLRQHPELFSTLLQYIDNMTRTEEFSINGQDH